MALRDAVVMGAMADWNYTPAGVDLSQPDTITYSNNNTTEALRATLTWGTTGGSDGNVTSAVWAYTADDTVGTPTWETIGTEAITYNADGEVTGVSWS